MNDPFFEYFLRERTTRSQALYGDEGPAYKTYSRYPQVPLSRTELPEATLAPLLQERHSVRTFADRPLSLDVLASLLLWSFGALGERPDTPHGTRRPHPSGGAKYPLELYPLIRSVEGLDPAPYHYNVPGHILERLPQNLDTSVLERIFTYDFPARASAVLLLTFVKSRSIRKYGGLAYKLGMLEAGHVGQTIYLTASALGIGCCALGGGDHPELYELLDIDGGNEHLVYAIAIGTQE